MKKGEKIDYEPFVHNKRVESTITREIKSSPNKIFPLACPVEEFRWIPDWDFQGVYSKSGVNETNCIFIEDNSGPLFFEKPVRTTWVTAIHDPENNHILFQLFMSDKASLRFDFRLRQVGIETSTCSWHFVFTAIDEEANQMSEEKIRSNLDLISNFLADTLKHYCETGKLLGE